MKCSICGKEFGNGANCKNCGTDRVTGLGNYSGYDTPSNSSGKVESSSSRRENPHQIVDNEPKIVKVSSMICHACGEIIPADSPVSMNLWGFGAEYIETLKVGFIEALVRILDENPMKGEYYIQTPINKQIADGSASYEVLTSSDKWFGVTYKEDKPDVVAKFAALKSEGFYPLHLWG